MDGHDSPGALDAELFEEGDCDDACVADVGVGVQEGGADHADYDDGDAPAEDLADVAYCHAASYGADVGDYLGHGEGIAGKSVLVLEERGVDVLRAV